LIQLRDCYNDGWKPDWNGLSNKFVIYFFGDEPTPTINVGCAKI